MHTFTDNRGNVWNVVCDRAALNRAVTANGGKRIHSKDLDKDPALMDMVLWEIIRPQAEERGITRADFAAAVTGDARQNANVAFARAMWTRMFKDAEDYELDRRMRAR